MKRPDLRRPDLPAVIGALVVAGGLLAAILLGNTIGIGAIAAEPVASGPRTAELPGSAGWRPLAWSPDGTGLLAVRGGAFSLAREEGGPIDLAGRLVDWWPGDPHTLSFVRPGASLDRLVLRDEEGAERIVVEAPGIVAVAWSGDGQTWAISAASGTLAGLLGGEPVALSPDRPPALTVAPSGDRVAYARGDVSAGRAGTLLVRDLVRGTQTWIGALELGPDDVLAWSPTGRFLAFTGRRGAEPGLFLLRPGSVEPALVLPGADPGSVGWSPDGLWLAAARLAAAGPVTELIGVEVGALSVRLRSLGPGRATAWGPLPRTVSTVRPDGRLVANPVEGGPPTELASDADPVCEPAASTVTRRIVYCTPGGGLRLLELPAD